MLEAKVFYKSGYFNQFFIFFANNANHILPIRLNYIPVVIQNAGI